MILFVILQAPLFIAIFGPSYFREYKVFPLQNSLQSALDLIKYIFVLLLPHENTFGILILLSYSFVSSGAIFMMSYAFKKKKLCCQSDDKPEKLGSSPQVVLNGAVNASQVEPANV